MASDDKPIPLVVVHEGDTLLEMRTAPGQLEHVFIELRELDERITKEIFCLIDRSEGWDIKMETQEDYENCLKCAKVDNLDAIKLDLHEKEGTGNSLLLTQSLMNQKISIIKYKPEDAVTQQ